jgi:hypothetical protein
LTAVAAHAGLAFPPERLAEMAAQLSPPSYYRPGFSDAEVAAIREETQAVARRLGYA